MMHCLMSCLSGSGYTDTPPFPQMPATPRSGAERAAPFGPKDPLISEAFFPT